MDFSNVRVPGQNRLRDVRPLSLRDGTCKVVFDCERQLTIDVPSDFHYHIAQALEQGEYYEEALLGWLAEVDLYTSEARPGSGGWLEFQDSILSDLPGGDLDGIFRVGSHLRCRIGDSARDNPGALLEAVFGASAGISRLTVHLTDSSTAEEAWLSHVMAEASRLGHRFDGELEFEVRLRLDALRPSLIEVLGAHPVLVHLECDGPRSIHLPAGRVPRPGLTADGAAAETLELLSHGLGDRLVVHALTSGGRLAHLWDWAKDVGLSRLHVTRWDLGFASPVARSEAQQLFRKDLDDLADDMLAGLRRARRNGGRGAGPALVYEPLARVVRRLAKPGYTQSWATSCLAVYVHGEVKPYLANLAGASQVMWPPEMDFHGEADGATTLGGEPAEAAASCKPQPCLRCWARQLCGHGTYGDPSLGRDDRLGEVVSHCDFWRQEIEAGILLYRQLLEEDPRSLLGLAPSPSRPATYEIEGFGFGGFDLAS